MGLISKEQEKAIQQQINDRLSAWDDLCCGRHANEILIDSFKKLIADCVYAPPVEETIESAEKPSDWFQRMEKRMDELESKWKSRELRERGDLIAMWTAKANI